jgi:AcrR family transcriptional regulator
MRGEEHGLPVGEVETSGGAMEKSAQYRRILSAAAKLFQIKGYHATSVREIGDRANVSQSSLYYHIHNKMQILVDLNLQFMNRLTPAMTKTVNREAQADLKIASIILEFMKVISKYQDEVSAVLRERKSLPSDFAAKFQTQRDEIDRMIDDVIRQGIAEGTFGEVDVTLARLALAGMVNWSYEWYRPGGELDPDTIARVFTSIILNGLRSRPELSPLEDERVPREELS